MEMLVGIDGCIRDQSTHLQTVVHLQGKPHVSLENTTIKLYPTSSESSSLAGWRNCNQMGRVPDELAQSRRVQTTAGQIMILVCNDATVFKGYDRRPIKDHNRLLVRQYLLNQAVSKPSPKYVLIATHWQGRSKTGSLTNNSFRKAAEFLADETGATVVTTLRTPKCDLVPVAHHFRVIGPQKDKVATLLVSDTYGD